MTFARRRNRLTMHFSERIPIFKWRMTVLYDKYMCVENSVPYLLRLPFLFWPLAWWAVWTHQMLRPLSLQVILAPLWVVSDIFFILMHFSVLSLLLLHVCLYHMFLFVCRDDGGSRILWNLNTLVTNCVGLHLRCGCCENPTSDLADRLTLLILMVFCFGS